MPDAPDSYPYLHIASLTPSTDVNELAAKLGSPSTNFREGQIVYQNDFRDGLKGLSLVETGSDGTVYIANNATTLTGNTVVLRNTTNDETYVGIAKTTPVYDTKYYIFGYLLAVQTSATNVFIYSETIQNGKWYLSWIKLDPAADKVYLYNYNGNWIEIASNLRIGTASDTNIRVILKIDISTGYYVSLTINDTVIDISQYQIRFSNTSFSDSLLTSLYVSSQNVNPAYLYVNSIVIACSDN